MWSPFKTTLRANQVIVPAFALAFAIALPNAGVASSTSEAGLWKVTRSTMGPNSGRMVIERVRKGETVTGEGTFVVIAKGKAYLATPANASAAGGGPRAVDYKAWGGMKLEHIGTNVRAIDDCGARCQHGFPGDRMTVTFKIVKKAPAPSGSVIALDEEE